MKEIILGREGNQPFKIDKEINGVSRQHAKITINDSNVWYLEDLDSSNGTFIRDENNGDAIPVKGKIAITPMAFVFLGPDSSKGCCFYAKQVLKENYGDFVEEFEYMNSKEDEFDEKVSNQY